MVYPSRSPMPDPLDVRKVMGLAECELNERVETAGARGRAARLATAVAVSVGSAAVFVRAAFGTVGPDLVAVWQGTVLLGALYVGYVWVSGRPAVRHAVAAVAVWVAAGLFVWAQSLVPDPVPAARWGLSVAGAVMLAAGHLITKQYVFFATANLNQPWEKSLRWRTDWADLFLLRSAPVPAAWRAAGAAVRVFLTYQTTPQHAPGLFRLPSRWLRPHPARLTLAALTLLPLAWAAADLPPLYTPPEVGVNRMFDRGAGGMRSLGMTREEDDFLSGLTHPDDRADYARLLFARRSAELDLESHSRREYGRRLVTALLVACTVPPGAFLLTLAAAAGPLLAAYHTAFESGDDE